MEPPSVTPSRPPPPIDISTIEAAKENIVPLHSGRSATQLASVFSSSSTRSGLGVKLEAEHSRFRAQIDAVDVYERTGQWEEGKDGLSIDQVAQLAEDPLDISHQYVRFIIANYPAGASAANRLVPVLEETTRKFLGDPRYTNDPRYFRLWAHYAKNMESPEDCYRFLFAKGIADKLAALYEEYAKVLEAVGKRKQADQVYQLGTNRKATPLDRLKRSHLDFQARMLVAPPLPSPPRPSTSTDSNPSTRPILSSTRTSGTTGGTGVGPKGNNGSSMFAVFKDVAGTEDGGKSAEWDDFGTVQSRERENELEKKEWSGETMPQKAGPPTGGFKLEVYRDETATALPHTHSLNDSDVFARSTRAPSEAEQLRSNPFKNYSSADVDLLLRDPLENLGILAPSAKKVKKSSSSTSTGEKKVKSSSFSSSSSKSKSKVTSSSTSTSSAGAATGEKKERVAVDLKAVYPSPGVEFSFEELRSQKKTYRADADSWNGWEWKVQWTEEAERTGRTTYLIDAETGWPVLNDPSTGAPLYDFLPRPVPPTPEQPRPSPPPAAEVFSTDSPTRASSQPTHSLLSPSPPRLQQHSPIPSPSSRSTEDDDEAAPSSYPFLDQNRPPSPTMNTKAANAMIDDLFAKTLDFTRYNGRSGRDGNGSDSEDEGEPSTDEDDDENGWPAGGPVDYGASQYSTQQATQASEVSSDAGFVPFSQTRSQMGDDSAFFGSQNPNGSQQSQLPHYPTNPYGPGRYRLNDGEDQENQQDENAPHVVPAPMQLFRDSIPATPSGGGFRPVTKAGSSARAPLGAKSIGGSLAAPPPQQPAFSVFQDPSQSQGGVFGDVVVPSSQHSENQGTLDSVYEEEAADYEAPLRGESDFSDGYAMGRRERGVPSRYAPFIDNMSPITERTLEITAAMNTHHSSLSASQRSRRSSAFSSNPAPVMEDDEPSSEDEAAGDRAFVGSYSVGEVEPSQEARGNDNSSDDSQNSDSDSDDDDDHTPPPPQQQPSLAVHSDFQSTSSRFDESSIARLSLGRDPSYDVSPNTSLPEGLTINGNQSGMTTGMVVHDATSTNRLSEIASLNPYNREMLEDHLARLPLPIYQHPNVVNLTDRQAGKLASLQKTAKKRETTKGKDKTGTLDDAWDLELDGEILSVREKLGEGSFGAVFRVALPNDEDDPDASFDADGTELFLAVKVERPTNLWEFHVLDQLQARLSERAMSSIVRPHRLYAYSDESFLLLDLCDRGSLLDAVNRAQDYRIAPSGPAVTGLDEILAIFFVIELLRTLEGFHAAGFIHGDLKIDNCLLRFEEVDGAWSTAYDPSGANGWSAKGLKVIDFGRTIDRSIFPEGQRFVCDFKTDQYDCAEMRAGQPWTFEPDYHGVASIAYCALFGHYMEVDTVEVEGGGRTKRVIKKAFRRYHQVELWTKLFDTLLNPRDVRKDSTLPITSELAGVRQEMEEWLVANCNKNGKSLKNLLSKLERSSLSR